MDNSDGAPGPVKTETDLVHALRKKAEAKLRILNDLNPEDMSLEEARLLLYELRIHQIELEIQNEELRQAQVELDVSRSRYFDLYDLAPVGYCTISEKGLIVEANLIAATLLGVPRGSLVNQPLTRFILPADQDIYYHHRKILFDTGGHQMCELRLKRMDGSTFWVRLEAIAALDGETGSPVCRVVISDVPDHKRSEESLRAALSESRQREKEIKGILDTVSAIKECRDFGESSRKIFDACRDIMGAVSGFVALLSDNNLDNVILFMESGGVPFNVNPGLLPVSDLRVEAYSETRVIYDNDFMTSQWVRFMPPGSVAMKNALFVPFIISGKVMGVMGLANKPSDFTDDDARIAKAFGDIAATSLRRVLAENALRASDERLSKIRK